jgi:PKD repeat protein
VKLTVRNNAGTSTATGSPAIVAGAPTIPPVAHFNFEPPSGTPPLSVVFTDTSTGSPTTWSWNFGDGSTSTLQDPTHTYTQFGTFNVILTVRNSAGSSAAQGTIDVFGKLWGEIAIFFSHNEKFSKAEPIKGSSFRVSWLKSQRKKIYPVPS